MMGGRRATGPSPAVARARLLAILEACWLVLFCATSASAFAPGNNGTLKIHEQGTPSGTEDNDPKVCVFNVEAFGLDSGQVGYLWFNVQGGDAPTGTDDGPYPFGPADATGYYASQYFTLADGHYKATLYGKMDQTEEKAKSKVFKVECAVPTPTVPATATPTLPATATPTLPATATPTLPDTPTPTPTHTRPPSHPPVTSPPVTSSPSGSIGPGGRSPSPTGEVSGQTAVARPTVPPTDSSTPSRSDTGEWRVLFVILVGIEAVGATLAARVRGAVG